MLWNCLGGGSSEVWPEVYKATLHVGDMLLFCTDGLTKCVKGQTIGPSESMIKQQLRKMGINPIVVRKQLMMFGGQKKGVRPADLKMP